MFGFGTILDVNPRPSGDDQAFLESLGHQVIVCSGPGDSLRCPLVEEGTCAIVDAADGVVFRLDLDEPYHREMLRCYRRELGETGPMHVVLGEGQAERYADLLAGLSVSVDEIGPGVSGFSPQVVMASAARVALSGPASSAHAPHPSVWTDET